MLRVVSPQQMAERDRQEIEDAALSREETARGDMFDVDLRNHIMKQWELMRNHRQSSGLNERLLKAMRVFNGEYDPAHLSEIKKFGGSEVYARVVGTKARGATALLRDVYFSNDRSWHLKPTPQPTMPDDIMGAIDRVVQMEAQTLQQNGMPVDEAMVQERKKQLVNGALSAARRQAEEEADRAEHSLDDFLVEGGYYEALAELLVDLPLFPYAVIKGPIVRMHRAVRWVEGQAQMTEQPKLFWERRSPFDIYWTPGVSSIHQADVIDRLRWTRRDLADLRNVPGWNTEAIEAALDEYDAGLRDWMDVTDSERAISEGREDPTWNRSGMIDAMHFHGSVQGRLLREIGFTAEEAPDELEEYSIECWLCGRYILKTMLSPSVRRRHPYYITSFEKVPGTVAGNALPDMLSDIEEVANASLRGLVNNMGLASGPQVVVMTNRFAATEDGDEIYPWKRWHMVDEPGQQSLPPIQFYQPGSNAAELLGIYQKMTELADDISAIPRYITGQGASGGAGRTASGLSMLMGNASKQLQMVAANVDRDILADTLQQLYDLVMLTQPGGVQLQGDESIETRGAATVMAKETERVRQLEFLQLTANPIDMQVIGIEGRADMLRHVSKDLGFIGGSPVPSREDLARRQQQALQAQQASAAAGAPPGEGEQTPGPATSTGPIENNVQPGFALDSPKAG